MGTQSRDLGKAHHVPKVNAPQTPESRTAVKCAGPIPSEMKKIERVGLAGGGAASGAPPCQEVANTPDTANSAAANTATSLVVLPNSVTKRTIDAGRRDGRMHGQFS